jgi:hypothetical protein
MKRALIVAVLGCACMTAPLAAQAQQAVTPYKKPHNSLGQPDLEGFWSNATLTPMTRAAALGDRALFTPAEVKTLENGAADAEARGNANSDPNAPQTGASADVGGYNRGWLDPGSTVMRVHGEPRDSLITTPDGQVPPRKGQAVRTAAGPARRGAARGGGAPLNAVALGGGIAAGGGSGQGNVAAQQEAYRRGAFDNPESRSLGERCILSFGRNAGPPMFANGFYNNNYQIVQSRDAVAINIEMVHDTRIIPLNAKHRTDGVRPWFGDSIGWYDGDTLVVETTNMPQRLAFNGSWENLKVTERFTRVAKDRVLYQFTIDDPTLWDKPWGGEYEFAPLNGRIQEYACHEGNYALEGILAGAREQERLDAEAAKKKAVAAN